jgi:hypothetical protein
MLFFIRLYIIQGNLTMKTNFILFKSMALAAGLLLMSTSSFALQVNNQTDTTIAVNIKDCVKEPVATNLKMEKSFNCTNCKGKCNYTITYSFNPKKTCSGSINDAEVLDVTAGPTCNATR